MNNNLKSATTAGLLGIFLGSVGAHNWYLGEKKQGIIHVSLLGAGLVLEVISVMMVPKTVSLYTLSTATTNAGMTAIFAMLAGLVLSGNAIWGLVSGIIILSQGDAGLAKKGFAVAQAFGGQTMNNMGNMNPGMNNMGNMNGINHPVDYGGQPTNGVYDSQMVNPQMINNSANNGANGGQNSLDVQAQNQNQNQPNSMGGSRG